MPMRLATDEELGPSIFDHPHAPEFSPWRLPFWGLVADFLVELEPEHREAIERVLERLRAKER